VSFRGGKKAVNFNRADGSDFGYIAKEMAKHCAIDKGKPASNFYPRWLSKINVS
jgi:hypothetical protein